MARWRNVEVTGTSETPSPQPRSSGMPPTLRRDVPRRVAKRCRRPPASGRLRGGGNVRTSHPFCRHTVLPRILLGTTDNTRNELRARRTSAVSQRTRRVGAALCGRPGWGAGRLPQQGGHAGCLRHPADRPYRKTGRFYLDSVREVCRPSGSRSGTYQCVTARISRKAYRQQVPQHIQLSRDTGPFSQTRNAYRARIAFQPRPLLRADMP